MTKLRIVIFILVVLLIILKVGHILPILWIWVFTPYYVFLAETAVEVALTDLLKFMKKIGVEV